MIVKAVDIARELGISKATVSLALNNKPGVNEKTKQAILECKARLEQQVRQKFWCGRTRSKSLCSTQDSGIWSIPSWICGQT